VVPVSGPELLYISDGAEWVVLNPAVEGSLLFSNTFIFNTGSAITDSDNGLVNGLFSGIPLPQDVSTLDIATIKLSVITDLGEHSAQTWTTILDDGDLIGIQCTATDSSQLVFTMMVDGVAQGASVNVSNPGSAAEIAAVAVLLYGPAQ
jgi:hypothetical protein